MTRLTSRLSTAKLIAAFAFSLSPISGISAASQPEPVPVVFDTDIMGDVDDVGAVALLHALADRGEVKILAMGVSGKNPASPLCLDALNGWFGRPEIPLGVVKGPAFDKGSRYADAIADEFPHRLASAEEAPDAAHVYREVLAGQPDGSVVMISVGQLTNFRNLLQTDADRHSRLDGRDLVKQKVRAWVCMGGRFPDGREANLVHDGPAAAAAIANWPTPIIFSGWEIGNEIMTGAGLVETPASSPVRRSYQLYNGLKDRQSWDQTAVLYAVRGLDGGLADFWDLKTGGCLHVEDDGANVWRDAPDRGHSYLVTKMSPERIAKMIEQLMLHQPSGGKGEETMLLDFRAPEAAAAWRAVNDGVMGGVSTGEFRITNSQTLEFFGNLSLENDGGFASIRTVPGAVDLAGAKALRLRFRGDGRTYLLNLYVPTRQIAFSYRAAFETDKGKWLELSIPLTEFKATSFGREVAGADPLDPAKVQSIGFMLSDKTPGPFKLEVDWIKTIAEPSSP